MKRIENEKVESGGDWNCLLPPGPTRATVLSAGGASSLTAIASEQRRFLASRSDATRNTQHDSAIPHPIQPQHLPQRPDAWTQTDTKKHIHPVKPSQSQSNQIFPMTAWRTARQCIFAILNPRSSILVHVSPLISEKHFSEACLTAR
jgi:hypothetical protein